MPWVVEQVRQDLLDPWIVARHHAEQAPQTLERVAVVVARTRVLTDLLLADPQLVIEGAYLRSLRGAAHEALGGIRSTPALGPGGWARTCRVVVCLALVQDWVRWMRPAPRDWETHWMPRSSASERQGRGGVGLRPEPIRLEDGLPTPRSLDYLVAASGLSCDPAPRLLPPRDPGDLKRLLCDPDRAWRLLAQRYMGAAVATPVATEDEQI